MSGRFRRKANHDWWKRLDEAAERHQVEWRWAQGHVEPAVLQDAVDKIGVIEPEEAVDDEQLF